MKELLVRIFVIYASNTFYLNDSFVYDQNFNVLEEAKPFVKNGTVNFSNLVISGTDRQEIKLYKKSIDETKFQIIDTDLIAEKQLEFIIGTIKLMMWESYLSF